MRTSLNKHISAFERVLEPEKQVLLQRCLEHQKDVYLCFIDFEKAFDTVKYEKLVRQLEKIGLEDKELQIIKNLYWKQTATVKYENNYTQEVPTQRQDCILSPILFNIYSEEIFNQISEITNIDIQVNGH